MSKDIKQTGNYMVVLRADDLWGQCSWTAAWFDSLAEARGCMEGLMDRWTKAARLGKETFDDPDLGDELPADLPLEVFMYEELASWVAPDPNRLRISKETIIAVGEPGCYVFPGFLDEDGVAEMIDQVCDWYDEDPESLGPERMIWMLVTQASEDDASDQTYREVHPETPGAAPFTLIPVKGYWPELPEWMQEAEEVG